LLPVETEHAYYNTESENVKSFFDIFHAIWKKEKSRGAFRATGEGIILFLR